MKLFDYFSYIKMKLTRNKQEMQKFKFLDKIPNASSRLAVDVERKLHSPYSSVLKVRKSRLYQIFVATLKLQVSH